jgi:hypothetical protein
MSPVFWDGKGELILEFTQKGLQEHHNRTETH